MNDTIAAPAPKPTPEPSQENKEFSYKAEQTYDTTQANLDRLEHERNQDVPKYERHNTPGGTVEQEVNREIREHREKRIKALQETMKTKVIGYEQTHKR